MGGAIAKALKQNFNELSSLVVSDRDPAKHAAFSELEVDVTDSNADAVTDSDVVILAVKPQQIGDLEIAGKLKGDAIVISIMAGVPIEKIREILDGHSYIARVMPNLPALISEGMSGFYAPDLTGEQKSVVVGILKSFGDEIELKSEDEIDKITAISGSGPAYVFYFLEAMTDAGVELGFGEETAKKLALKTLLGSGKYAKVASESFSELREKVTSKGGATEKALQVLNNYGFKKSLVEAINSAYKKAKELGS